MTQSWRWLTFLHWRYDPALVRPLVPQPLELDLFEGAAWVGLVPFKIFDFPGLPSFPETNVRTYVIGPDGSRAVWFFSLDAERLMAVIGARAAFGLPYYWAKMRVAAGERSIAYSSRRRWPHSHRYTTDLEVRPGELFAAGELAERDHFLTARFRLYSIRLGKLSYTQIEHEPWPLARCAVAHLQQNLIEAAGLPAPQGDPLAHYSADLHVKIGPPQFQSSGG